MRNPEPPTAVVVNDDLFQLRLTSTLLEKDGIRAIRCQSVEEALGMISQLGRVDLILTDLYMPGIDGWRFCRIIRSPEYTALNNIPVLVMSATFSGADAEEVTKDLGANAFLPVPYDPSTLRSCVRALLEGRVAQTPIRVLVIEDSPAQLNLFTQAFQAHGYLVYGAMTGEEGRRLFQEHSPEITVLDYYLPDRMGDELLEEFKQSGTPSVVVIITTDQSPERALSFMRKGADSYVRKPFEPEFLIDLCQKAHRERSLLRVEKLLEERTRKLRLSEARYRAIVEDQTELILRFLPNGTLTFVNEACCRYFGKRREDLIGDSYLSLFPEKERERLEKHLATLSELSPVVEMEQSIISPDGKAHWQQWTHRALFDEQSRFIEFQSVGRDITLQRWAEEERHAIEEQLRQSQKMEAIGRLAGGMAHDYNNLLTVINGYSDLLLMDRGQGDPLRHGLEEIKKAGDQAAALTEQLMAFGRRQITKLKVINLNEILREMEGVLRRLIGEGIDLATFLAEDLGNIKVDRGQMEQMILNLAVNAREAMPKGGKLTLETANVDLDEAYARTHIEVAPGPYVQLTVMDTGGGMAPEVRERIFEPFFTTKGKGRGVGLGLSTCYGIVKQTGGSIWVHSEPGQGTTFKICLPRQEEEIPATSRRDEKGPFPIGNETLLLVEDERSVRSLAAQVLRDQGYRVLEASNGLEALEVVEEHSTEEIHLLLTDVVMPKMGGGDLAQRLKSLRPHIKVLFISGYTDNAIMHLSAHSPDIDFLQKPFSMAALARKVREALDR